MNQQMFLKMINAAIKEETLNLSDIDEEFIRVAKEQTFQPMLYTVTKDPKYRKYYIQSALIHEKFNRVGQLVDDILNEAKIPHIFLKGYELQNLYPDPNLRMMGDIDILVDQKDHNKAEKFLIANGNFAKGKDDEHHLKLFKENITIELHHNLFEDFRETSTFFSTPFDNTFAINKFRLQLNIDYYFIYIVSHYAKHICAGAGLREIIDIYLFLRLKDINLNFVENELNKLGLSKFYNMILNELYIIFGYNNCSMKINNNVHHMISYSLNCGIHGYGEKHDMNQISKNILRISKGNKINFLFTRLFIPLKELFEKYPWTKSIILIPFGYIYRFFFLIVNKKSDLKKAIQYKKTKDFYLLKSLDLITDNDKIF